MQCNECGIDDARHDELIDDVEKLRQEKESADQIKRLLKIYHDCDRDGDVVSMGYANTARKILYPEI